MGAGLLLALEAEKDLGHALDQQGKAGDLLGGAGNADGADDVGVEEDGDGHARPGADQPLGCAAVVVGLLAAFDAI